MEHGLFRSLLVRIVEEDYLLWGLHEGSDAQCQSFGADALPSGAIKPTWKPHVTATIIVGDALTELRKLPDESVQCCVTSPPYWGLRNYGVDGQLGLEPTIGAYIENMVAVFREVRRVLRDDGTLWLNVGDSYAANRGDGASSIGAKQATNAGANLGRLRVSDGLKPKDLCGIPWRLAFALQADGWWLRQDIIWSKPNPMPESVTDRCTKAHEYIFLLSKSERYAFDADAIAEPIGTEPNAQSRGPKDTPDRGPREGGNGGLHNMALRMRDGVETTRNKRSVWTVTTQGYSEAHFATFPPALIEPCILAGCPVGGTVLDCFGGAGTTGLVADRLQRNSILIELNPQYAEMARKRILDDAPMFASVVRERSLSDAERAALTAPGLFA